MAFTEIQALLMKHLNKLLFYFQLYPIFWGLMFLFCLLYSMFSDLGQQIKEFDFYRRYTNFSCEFCILSQNRV